MKRIVLVLVALAVMFMIVPVYAAEMKPINIVINGEIFVSPEGEPAPYANKDQRTLIPIRFFAEKLGVPNDEEHIKWDQASQTATITDGTNIVEIPMGSKEIRVNGEKVLMDTVAEVKNQRIFIPARYLAEGLGANVYWDQEDQTAVFMTQEYIDNHRVKKTKRAMDIDDPYLALEYYDLLSEKYRNIRSFGDSQTFLKRMKEARALANKIKIDVDKENGTASITLPKYDKDDFYIILDTVTDGKQYLDAGTYSVAFKDAMEGRKLFYIDISDRNYGAAVLYGLYGMIIDDEFMAIEGTKGFDMFVSLN
ncbi:hypothetical protein PRECH8_04530 [Insulibacter thermoxylanivorax]|uniref:Copper amine oxidase-like N-terminal domain-containing protein n=1 Tax=Insulibacter thermoxylanivorax TaxID=2749268 RepID=A0A916QAG9_9BACL|nr:copper amine oxidase N-terminal domain-containing protein [Insulibacter thermoxylanivorax]GFR37157.1 hypothetical protein PRECH8_04530 [Insulibacter thermoxylanivorax]